MVFSNIRNFANASNSVKLAIIKKAYTGYVIIIMFMHVLVCSCVKSFNYFMVRNFVELFIVNTDTEIQNLQV